MELVNAQRQLAVYGQNEFADAGGLMSYSFSVIEQYRSGATFIDKILKGANPAELPVEQPTHFESEGNINALRALAPLPRAPVPRPSRPQPRTPQPRGSRRPSCCTIRRTSP